MSSTRNANGASKRRKLDDGTSTPAASGSGHGGGRRGNGHTNGGTRSKANGNSNTNGGGGRDSGTPINSVKGGNGSTINDAPSFALNSLSTESVHSYMVHHSLFSENLLQFITFESVSRPLPRHLPSAHDETSSQSASAEADDGSENGGMGGHGAKENVNEVATRKSSRKKTATARAKDSAVSYGSGIGVNAPSAGSATGGGRKRERDREEEEGLFDLSAWDTEEEWRRRLCAIGKWRWDKEARSIREGETLAGFLYSVRNKNRVLKVDL